MDQQVSTNTNRELWEKGDFTKIAAFMRQSGETLVRALDITPEMQVLDLGCGDGTTAVPAAMLGAEVLGVDIASNLVAAGKQRASAAGLNHLKFQHGDACNLQDLADHTFDLTISVFGAMFAPEPFDVAREMVRVTKRGGRIVMGNWIPNDPTFVSQLLKTSVSFMPAPPQGSVSPMTWGEDAHVVERFVAAGVSKENISTTRDSYHFVSPHAGPEEFIELFRKFYGPTMLAFEAAERVGKQEDLHQQLVTLAKAHNKNANGGTHIAAAFLRVTISL